MLQELLIKIQRNQILCMYNLAHSDSEERALNSKAQRFETHVVPILQNFIGVLRDELRFMIQWGGNKKK